MPARTLRARLRGARRSGAHPDTSLHAFARPSLLFSVGLFLAAVAEDALGGSAAEGDDQRVEAVTVARGVLALSDDAHGPEHSASGGRDADPSWDFDGIDDDLEGRSFHLGRIEGDLEARSFDLEQIEGDLEARSFDLGGSESDLEPRSFDLGRIEGDLEGSEGDLEGRSFGLERIEGDLEARSFDLERIEGDLEARRFDLEEIEDDLEARSFDLERIEGDLEARSSPRGETTADRDLRCARSGHQQGGRLTPVGCPGLRHSAIAELHARADGKTGDRGARL